jgi:Peptide N-acetyl-beta-D-glucosaminyl asparaginase amidase A
MRHLSAAGTLLAINGLFLWASVDVQAQVVIAPATPQIGSSNPVTADPPVPRPRSRSCTVPLLTNEEFADFNTKNFSYTPPAACQGPWARVVLAADFTVTAGRQFDRTAQFYLGGANIYFGTTSEPRAALSPSWHVERDVTDLSAIFKSAQAGTAILGNFIGVSDGVTYNGIIFGNAALEFYPASSFDEVPRTPDLVIGIPGNSGATTVNTSADPLTQALTLPTNVESAYLDVVAQSQSNDEFWYLCVPNDLANALESCGNTGFRETEVAIDGQPAGVAPVYPWIYTGGIDPALWEPIPGVQTLDLKPYRVDLTPFAGMLSDGKSHTLAVGVFNADSYFAVTGNLLLYLDPHSKQVTGGIVSNDLTASPQPQVLENVTTAANGDASGPVSVTSTRKYSITGYVNTSRGRVETTVSQQMSFGNRQTFTINATTYIQDLEQTTTVDAKTTTREGFLTSEAEHVFSYPLSLKFSQTTNSDGSIAVLTNVDQQYLENDVSRRGEIEVFSVNTSNHVSSQDTVNDTAQGVAIGRTGSSSQEYVTRDSRGDCYSRNLTSVNDVLTAFQDDTACRDRK